MSLHKDVKVPDDIFYHGLGQSAGAAFGIIGAIVAASAAEEPKGQLKAAMAQAQISLAELVRQEFATQLAEARLFPSMVDEGASAEVKLEVRIYGFGQPHGLSAQLKPMLGIRGMLTRADGTVLWERYEFVSTLNAQTPSHTLEEYLANPQLIRGALAVASKLVVGVLVKHMQGP